MALPYYYNFCIHSVRHTGPQKHFFHTSLEKESLENEDFFLNITAPAKSGDLFSPIIFKMSRRAIAHLCIWNWQKSVSLVDLSAADVNALAPGAQVC